MNKHARVLLVCVAALFCVSSPSLANLEVADICESDTEWVVSTLWSTLIDALCAISDVGEPVNADSRLGDSHRLDVEDREYVPERVELAVALKSKLWLRYMWSIH